MSRASSPPTDAAGTGRDRSPLLGFSPEILVVLAAALPLPPQRHRPDGGREAERPAHEPPAAATATLDMVVVCHAPLRPAPDRSSAGGVGQGGLEPPTSPLSGVRSNQAELLARIP